MGRPLRLALGLVLAAALCGSAAAVEIEVDGRPLVSDAPPQIVNETTYVPLRAVTQALSPGAEVGWEGRAVVRGAGLTLTAEPGEPYIEANGRALYVKDGVLVRPPTCRNTSFPPAILPVSGSPLLSAEMIRAKSPWATWCSTGSGTAGSPTPSTA